MPSWCTAFLAFATAALAGSVLSARGEGGQKDLSEGLTSSSPGGDLFLRAYEVLSHPRCSNCHPRDDRPRWGTAGGLHGMNVQRGVDQPAGNELMPEGGYGRPGMPCQGCHQERNAELPGSPPGAPRWRLAPLRMGWAGLSATELCLQFKSFEGHDGLVGAEAVIGHIVKPRHTGTDQEWQVDPLVSWAWKPGRGREPAPGQEDQFVRILTWWRDGGGACPAK